MKQKDIALIIVISFIGLFLGIVASNLLFNKNNKKLSSDVITAIVPDFVQPDKRYFNSNSVDPTQIIRIGENTNQKPFNQ
jgi:hypothetical protein